MPTVWTHQCLHRNLGRRVALCHHQTEKCGTVVLAKCFYCYGQHPTSPNRFQKYCPCDLVSDVLINQMKHSNIYVRHRTDIYMYVLPRCREVAEICRQSWLTLPPTLVIWVSEVYWCSSKLISHKNDFFWNYGFYSFVQNNLSAKKVKTNWLYSALNSWNMGFWRSTCFILNSLI